MRALVFETFGGPLSVRDVPAPDPAPGGVVVRVGASGICRSDWHAWQGHDPDVVLPHVPGHELAGTVAAVGADVRRWRVGDRVTVPFVNACGRCAQCAAGEHQVCTRQTQPGFTHWGSMAEYVALDAADVNLVALPDGLDVATAAALGCRFATAFRAVVQVARVQPGEWVAVHGCGGVGLSAVQVAVAAGAHVVAVDVAPGALELAGTGEQAASLAEQVERQVEQRDVLLELRRACCPLAQPLPEHEPVVAEPQAVLRDVEVDLRRRPHQMCETSSGTV